MKRCMLRNEIARHKFHCEYTLNTVELLSFHAWLLLFCSARKEKCAHFPENARILREICQLLQKSPLSSVVVILKKYSTPSENCILCRITSLPIHWYICASFCKTGAVCCYGSPLICCEPSVSQQKGNRFCLPPWCAIWHGLAAKNGLITSGQMHLAGLSFFLLFSSRCSAN